MTATLATVLVAIQAAARMDKQASNLWVTLCNALKGMSYDAAKLAAANGEEEWKAANPKADALPSAWRSAKSVALTALKNGVALHDESDNVRGKTEVEKLTKEAKGEKAVMDKVRSTLDTLDKLYAQCDSTERAEFRNLLANMSIRLFEEAKAQGEAS